MMTIIKTLWAPTVLIILVKNIKTIIVDQTIRLQLAMLARWQIIPISILTWSTCFTLSVDFVDWLNKLYWQICYTDWTNDSYSFVTFFGENWKIYFVHVTKGQFQIRGSAKTRFKVNSLNIHGFLLSQYLKPLKEHSFM